MLSEILLTTARESGLQAQLLHGACKTGWRKWTACGGVRGAAEVGVCELTAGWVGREERTTPG